MSGRSAVDDPLEGAVVNKQQGRSGIEASSGMKSSKKCAVRRVCFICESWAVANYMARFVASVTYGDALLSVSVVVPIAVPSSASAASVVTVVVAIAGGVRSGEQRVLFSGEADFLCVCCNGQKNGRYRGRDVDLCGILLEVNAEVVDHGLYVGLVGDAGDNVLRPNGMKREGLEFDDVAESREAGRSTGGLEVSDRGEDVVPKRRERLVLSLRQGQAIRVDADVAAPLELVAKVNCGPHICAEGRRGNSATLEEGPIRSLVCPFVEEVGEAILTTCVVFFERRGLRCEEMARWGRCSGCTGSATT